jgi:1-acyl-sn-glycerol-3-phosphate acyltransferase
MIARIRVAVAFLVMGLVSIPLIGLQIAAVRTGFLDPGRLPVIWHKLAARILGVRTRVRGWIAEGRPLLIAANHISWLDVTVLSSLAPMSFIAKSDMAVWPVFGTFARLQRSVFVEREHRGRSAAQASEIGRRLAAGDAMVLFPEGTTADGNFLAPFKSSLFGAARLAIEEGSARSVLIQPVAIAYTGLHGMPIGRRHMPLASWIGDSDLVPHLLRVLREGAFDVDVVFGEPVEFTAASSRKEVARLMEARVRRMREESLRGLNEK